MKTLPLLKTHMALFWKAETFEDKKRVLKSLLEVSCLELPRGEVVTLQEELRKNFNDPTSLAHTHMYLISFLLARDFEE
jgi:hypothetical protein